MNRIGSIAATGLAVLCAAGGGPSAHAAGATLSREDALWLERVTYGPTTATVSEYLKLGRRRYLDEQLHRRDPRLPPQIAAQIDALQVSHSSAPQLLLAVTQEQQRINALSDDAAKQADRKALNEQGNHMAYEAARRELLRAIYSQAQIQEQMTWFWLNHFSVFQYKANDAWLVADYADTIRAHALGHFRDLVIATLTHPAMLQYLDNAQNAAGHLNENYARELMELHT